MRTTDAKRSRALDGLRGLAAVVVLIHHSLLVIPSLAGAYYGNLPSGGLPWIAVHTPLHLVWAGIEAVYLFFVLSGLVLARSVMATDFQWARYFPSRLIRLYVPVVAAVAFGWFTIQMVPRVGEGLSAWVEHRPDAYTIHGMVTDVVLLTGVSGVISPLWSLQWEVLFSLLLPVYVHVGRQIPLIAQLVLALMLSSLGSVVGVSALVYLPMFALGTALGLHWDRISSRLKFANSARNGIIWLLVLLVACVSICSYWLAVLIFPEDVARPLTMPLILLGVCACILVVSFWEPAERLLSRPLYQWLGLISFSLYLVHEPIVLGAAFAFQGERWGIVAAVLASFCAAIAFYWFIERPAHRWSRAMRRAGLQDAAVG